MNMFWTLNAPTIKELEQVGFTCELHDDGYDALKYGEYWVCAEFNRDTKTLDEIGEWRGEVGKILTILYDNFPTFEVYDEFECIDYRDVSDEDMLKHLIECAAKWRQKYYEQSDKEKSQNI